MELLAVILSATAIIIALCAIFALNRSVKALAEKVGAPPATIAAPAAMPVISAAPQDGALVAAITGALMAHLGRSVPKGGLVVRQIRRVTPHAWGGAGRADQLQNRL